MPQFDPLDLKGQERAKLKQDERARICAEQEADDIKWLMGDKRGRRIVARQLDLAGVFRSSFTGNSETFFREGQRNVGLVLLAKIHSHAPEQYAVMLKEQANDAGNDDDGRDRNAH
ncbi:hypothetical protein J5J83_19785 [Azoarcus sp. L1K30]|uniref:Bbp19 family protein n=1 Tax=Azoarcus sp. L1K30 TaxID=2820277 RepID=UPI001B83B5CB|nr:hypothetical protein [Azoarcus sp. L1K30]MBR0568369.1 hypothetical protein [Azoarcus sp. L1K30]